MKKIKIKVLSFGVRFTRSKFIKEVLGRNNSWVEKPGDTVTSDRRFKSPEEAFHHAKRFKRIEKHKAFEVVVVLKRANAWVNFKTGKTNPIIGAKRTNRR